MSVARPDRLAVAEEYMDSAEDLYELEASLDHVVAVNRWLGGNRGILRAMAPLIEKRETVTLLDVGTGSGDVPRVLAAWAVRRGNRFATTLLDRNRSTLGIAVRRTRALRFPAVCADVRALPFRDRAFDFALITLTLHHLDNADQPVALRELARVTRRAVIVSELERSWPNLLGARFLAHTLWRRNRLTRHDGPISVRRGFTAAELTEIARKAGLAEPRVRRGFFQRLVLVAIPDPEHGSVPGR